MKTFKSSDIVKKYISALWVKKYYKKVSILFCIWFIFILTGCTVVEDYVMKKSGMMTDEEYQTYIELRDSGQIDQDGYYITTEIAEDDGSSTEGAIHVTIADNPYLKISYYLDEARTNPIEGQTCYLNPNDSIYTMKPECNRPSSKWYRFDKFRVYAYGNNGKKAEEVFWNEEENEGGLVLHVPQDCKWTEISIVPVGKYEKRSIKLEDYYIDSTEQKQNPSGTWIVNGNEVSNRNMEVSPIEALEVDYKYDSEKYCYVNSSPASYYHENGVVRFETIGADSDTEEYYVELRLTEGHFWFDPSEYPIEHGSVVFTYKNRVITEGCPIPDGEEIEYKAEADFGYRHPNVIGKIIVDASDEDDTKAKIKEAVKFYVDEQREVILPRPKGGTIEYTADGEILAGETYMLNAGTVITMKFSGWNGWICNAMDGSEYVVMDKEGNQSVSIEGIDINNELFVESDSHKPTLNVVLDDSVKETLIDVSASNVYEKDLNYAEGNRTSIIPDWLGQNDRIVFEDSIGTDKDIIVTVKNDVIMDGDAFRLEIVMTDTNGNENESIQYITKLPDEKNITIYNEKEIATSLIVYEDIKITVSRVKITTYEPKTIEHAAIQLEMDNKLMEAGDILELSRDIAVTITPEKGYCVTGSKVNRGVYNDSMEYSEWEKDWEKILDKHPIKKLWKITLDTSDDYGVCTYKLDGEVVSGTIEAYDGQKLTLEYTLTDSDYQIMREKGIRNFFNGIVNKEKEEATIPVSEELDGRTINRSQYISIERKAAE